MSALQGLGEKANDSLDMMFDTTACGEYKSYNSSHLGQSQPCEEDEAEEDDDGRLSDLKKLYLSSCNLTFCLFDTGCQFMSLF